MKKYKFPNYSSDDPYEKKLVSHIYKYTCPSSASFDPQFVEKLKSFGWDTLRGKTENTINEIDLFYVQNGYLPRQDVKDPEENRLGSRFSTFVCPSSKDYQPAFAEKHKDSLKYKDFIFNKNRDDLRNFCTTNGYRVTNTSSKDVEEKRMATIYWSISQNNNSECQKLLDEINKFPTKQEFEIKQKKLEIIKWCDLHGHRPSRVSKNNEEKQLAFRLDSYAVSKNHSTYDKEFANIVLKYPSSQDWKTNEQIEQLLKFCQKMKHHPNICSKNIEEKRLGNLARNILNGYNHEFSEDVKEELLKYPSWQQYKINK